MLKMLFLAFCSLFCRAVGVISVQHAKHVHSLNKAMIVGKMPLACRVQSLFSSFHQNLSS